MYNITELQNSVYVVDIMHYANDVTGGMLGTMFIISIFFIMFFSFKLRYEFDDTLTTSFFLTFVISIFLYLAGLVSLWFMIGFGMGTILCVLYLYFIKK